MEQPGFNFTAKLVSDRAEKHRTGVYSLLAGGQWWTSRQLAQGLAGFDHRERRHLDRVLRQIAEQSHGQIISGQKGYKLTKFATVEEIDHAEKWLLSQARKMQERAVEIRKARNHGGQAA